MRQKGFAPVIILILIALVITGFVVYSSKNKSVKTIPTPLETSTPITSAKPTPTIKPAVKTAKPSPTVKPTPVVVIDSRNTCGQYDYKTRPALPAGGQVPVFVSLSPAGGTSLTLAGFQWDYDGDGNWDTGTITSTTNHVYTSVGTYHPKFRVVATNSSVSETCNYPFDVQIDNDIAFQNDIISVDKTYFEITVSKSKQNYQFPWYEQPFFNDQSTIYYPAFRVSAKQKFTYITIKGDTGINLGLYGTGINLDAGTSYITKFWVNKNIATGTYQGSAIVTYTTNEGHTTNDGPTVNYKITVTD